MMELGGESDCGFDSGCVGGEHLRVSWGRGSFSKELEPVLVFWVGLQVGGLQWGKDVGGELFQSSDLIDGAGC